MTVRRLSSQQPAKFSFTSKNIVWAKKIISHYPKAHKQSAVLPILWRAQEQEGWLSEPALRVVAEMLEMPYMRVLEVATFYSMFHLQPMGKYCVQVCGTTPCWLRGARELTQVCQRMLGKEGHFNASFNMSWQEVECLGACVDAPVVQVNENYYENLNGEKMESLLVKLRHDATSSNS